MSNPELLKLTASEPLTLDQEYEMQETWRNDEDSMFYHPKIYTILSISVFIFNSILECTFLILNKDTYERTHDEIGL